jgi:glyoxylate reductase
MGNPTVLWCWIDAPWIRQYLPPDKVHLRILSTRGVSPSGEDLAGLAKDVDVIVVRRYFQVTRRVIQGAKHLKLIQRMGRMTGNIDVVAAQEKGVPVAILPMGLDMAVAEHAFMFMLALSRKLIESHHAVVRGAYEAYGLTPTVTTERSGLAECWIPIPMEALYHKTLGIIGMGEIGIAVAERAKAFDMRVLYFKRKRLPQEEEQRRGIEYASLEELLRASDFVSLHVPHTAETHRMLGAKEFARMKPSAYLINVARGGVIDEKALCEALRKKVIAGAGLDVFEREPVPKENPLLGLDNVICTPHSAAIYPKGSNIVHDVQRASENIFSILKGGALVHGSLVAG